MRSRQPTSIAASPVLVGALTVLLTVVGTMLAYNANQGLPFVPTRELRLQVPSGANLVPGNEVREGGHRIGFLKEMKPVKLPTGRVGAELRLKLDQRAGEIPRDSRFAIRMRAAVGAKYIELERGSSEATYSDGSTVAVKDTTAPVELDAVLNAFDPPTRRGAQQTLQGLGDGAAGRGADLGEAIRRLPPLLETTEPVMATLADPDTRLRRFVREAADTVAALRPVAADQARLLTSAADTFEALSRDESALQEAITRAGPMLANGERALRATRPFLERTAGLAGDLRSATAELRPALPELNAALDDTIPVAERSPALSARLAETLGVLERVSGSPATGTGLRALTASVATLQPTIRYVGPAITVCNVANLFFTFLAETLSAPAQGGFSYRDVIPFTDPQDDDVGQLAANEFVTGRNVAPGGSPQHLHANYMVNNINEDGTADCEYGGGGYLYGANKWDTTPDRFYRRAVVDPGIPGSQGPVYATFDKNGKGSGRGPLRVPEGQTFTRDPGGRAAPEADR